MKKILFTVLALILLPGPLWGEAPRGKRSDLGLSLVFSANVQGEVEPCG